jgi:SNF2 family DNA or RNA helicase
MTWIERSRRTPYAHQIVGVDWLVDLVRPEEGRVLPGGLLVADEMRLGKTKQVIDAAQVLFERDEIDTVIVVAPNSVRDVWYDPEMGEIVKHSWMGAQAEVTEYHQKCRTWLWTRNGGPESKRTLKWLITNFDFIRSRVKRIGRGWTGPRLAPLLATANKKTLLVIDESSAVSNYRSLQTRSILALRRRCGRVWLLNGTPMSESLEDYYSQALILDPRILACSGKTEFMARYAVYGQVVAQVQTKWGKQEIRSVAGWKHAQRPGCCEGVPPSLQQQMHAWDGIGDLQQRLAPYVLRRERKDCMDLPPKLDPVILRVTLSDESWRVYKELRDEFAAWLGSNTVVPAAQAGVRVMRLAQVCGGYVGGLESLLAAEPCPACSGAGQDSSGTGCARCAGLGIVAPQGAKTPSTLELGREKLDVLMEHLEGRLREDPNVRVLIWCRFRAEMDRLTKELCSSLIPRTVSIHGGQTREERQEALRVMHPDAPAFKGPAALTGTLGTGSMGLNLAGAHEVIYYSNGWSLKQRLQSEDRPVGPGQTHPVSYHDLVACGPRGQRTVEHEVVAALRAKEDLARWSREKWIRILKEE